MAVICGVDGSPAARTALRWASREARLRAEPLIVVHAYLRPLAYGPASAGVLDAEPEHQRAQQLLTELQRAERDRLAGLRVEQQVHSGNAASALVQAAGAADLLVVGSRGAGGFEGLLLGSTAEHCARHAPCPVAVIPSEPREPLRRVVIGVDGSEPAKRAAAWGIREAVLHGASVDVVSVYLPYRAHRPFGAEFMDIASPGWEQRLRHAAEAATDDALAALVLPDGLEVTSDTDAGHPAEVLAERSGHAELVVVGSRGLGGFAGVLLGSVSRQLLHHARCPVVVVQG